MRNHGWSRILFCSLLAGVLTLLLGACASSASTTDDAVAAVSAAEPTEVPATAVPPTEVPPTATAEPDPTATPAPTAPPAPAYDFAAVGPVIDAFVAENELNGAGLIVVEVDDGVIHEHYNGEFSEERISLIASSSKMITAGVLLRLQDDGLLDINAPVADVADWGAGNPDITPAQLLSNSSGLVGLFPDAAYGPYLCQYLPGGTLQECAASIFETAGDDEDVIEPDTEFRYGGAQWQVAGAVAEVAAGKSWADLITEIYVEPCGLETLAYNNHFTQIGSGFDYPAPFNSDPGTLVDTENPNMEGGAYVTTGDYAKLLLMHLRGGMCGDTQVLSADALATMHGDRVATAYDGNAYSANTGYGMGWWVDRPSGRISDGGAYGSVPWIDLEDGYAAYLVVEASSDIGGQLADELYDIVEAAVTAGQ